MTPMSRVSRRASIQLVAPESRPALVRRQSLSKQTQKALVNLPAHTSNLDDLSDDNPPEAFRGASGRIYHGIALGCLRPHHLPRRLSIRLTENWLFEIFVLSAILLNCATLAWESPVDLQDTWKADVLKRAETTFAWIFTAELFIKVVAYGFIGHQHAYLRDPWCQLDFVVVSLIWVPLIFPGVRNYSEIRALRALRPLKTLRHLPGMSALVRSILNAIFPALSLVSGICLFLFLIFSIMGVELFKGMLHFRCTATPESLHCSADQAGQTVDACGWDGGTCTDFYEADGMRHPSFSAFDSLETAFLAIVQIATFDHWSPMMYGLMPSFPGAWIFFFLVVSLCGFFLVNLFLAVLYDEFTVSMSTREAADSQLLRRKSGVHLGNEVLNRLQAPFGTPDGSSSNRVWSASIRQVVLHPWFETVSLTMILFNLIVMCLRREGQSQGEEQVIYGIGHWLTVYVIFELIFTIVGLGWQDFWHGSNKAWAPFEFAVLIISCVDLSLSVLFPFTGEHDLVVFRVLRGLRALRFMRAARNWTALARALDAIVIGGRNLANLAVLLILFCFICAVSGMELFGGRCDPDSRLHFDYAGNALLTTLSIFTGAWSEARAACSPENGGAWADTYFVITLLIGFFVLVNLFIAVLFYAFSRVAAQDTSSASEDATLDSDEDTEDGPRNHGAPGSMDVDGGSFIGRLMTVAVTNRHFEQAIVALIMASSVCLALDRPQLDPASDLSAVLAQLNLIFTTIFSLEMLMKLAAYGLGYFSSGWNCLDAFVVTVSVASLVPFLPNNLSTLRILRILRPLRLLSRIPGMKVIFVFAVSAVGNILQVVAVAIFFQIVYSVLGMELYSGRFASCTDPAFTTKEACFGPASFSEAMSGNAIPPAASDRRWLNPRSGSFDNVVEANLLLFVASTGDAWQDFMFQGMDAGEKHVAPHRNDSSLGAIYFVLWVIIGSFGTMNLLIGTVVDSFNRINNQEAGSSSMTTEQKQWKRVQQTTYANARARERAPRPNDPLRRAVHSFVTGTFFDTFISVWVVLNVAIMGFDYQGIERHPRDAALLEWMLSVFTSVYYVECILKLIGLGVSEYFADGWCRFDFSLVALSILEHAIANVDDILPVPPMLFRILRILRVLRILRLVKNSKGVQDLIMTLVMSFPALQNIVALLSLACFMYGVLGMNLFSYVLQPGSQLNAVRNFETLPAALLILLQCLTYDNWSGIMLDLMVGPDQGCDLSGEPTDCGSPVVAVLYFFTFMVVCNFVLLNIIVAVVMDNFSELREWNPRLCSEHDVSEFNEEWSVSDPMAEGFIHLDDCAELLLRLSAPLGLRDSINAEGQSCDHAMAIDFMHSLPLSKTAAGMVDFEGVLNALILRAFENELVEAPEEVVAKLEKKLKSGRQSLGSSNFYISLDEEEDDGPGDEEGADEQSPAKPDQAARGVANDAGSSALTFQGGVPQPAALPPPHNDDVARIMLLPRDRMMHASQRTPRTESFVRSLESDNKRLREEVESLRARLDAKDNKKLVQLVVQDREPSSMTTSEISESQVTA